MHQNHPQQSSLFQILGLKLYIQILDMCTFIARRLPCLARRVGHHLIGHM